MNAIKSKQNNTLMDKIMFHQSQQNKYLIYKKYQNIDRNKNHIKI